ncbi:MAG: Sb-PDE family phosphodiesterase, partial [Bryobacteraceae bacterium]
RGLFQGAVKVESPELRARPGATLALRLRNDSALPFRLQVRGGGWLRPIRTVDLRGQTAGGLPVAVAKEAPEGSHNLEVQLEITNCYTAPGQHLMVRLPVRLTIGR